MMDVIAGAAAATPETRLNEAATPRRKTWERRIGSSLNNGPVITPARRVQELPELTRSKCNYGWLEAALILNAIFNSNEFSPISSRSIVNGGLATHNKLSRSLQ